MMDTPNGIMLLDKELLLLVMVVVVEEDTSGLELDPGDILV